MLIFRVQKKKELYLVYSSAAVGGNINMSDNDKYIIWSNKFKYHTLPDS